MTFHCQRFDLNKGLSYRRPGTTAAFTRRLHAASTISSKLLFISFSFRSGLSGVATGRVAYPILAESCAGYWYLLQTAKLPPPNRERSCRPTLQTSDQLRLLGQRLCGREVGSLPQARQRWLNLLIVIVAWRLIGWLRRWRIADAKAGRIAA